MTKIQIKSDDPNIKVGDNIVKWICDCGRINDGKTLTCLCGFNAYLGKKFDEPTLATNFKGRL